MAKDELIIRAWNGLARLQLAVAIMLFAPRFSLDYWQGWLYWLVSGAGYAGLTVSLARRDRALLARRMDVGAAAETRPRQKLSQRISGTGFVLLLVVSSVDQKFGVIHVPEWISVVCSGLVGLSCWMILRTFLANSYTAATVRVEAEQELADKGPYAWVRHPMYSSGILGFLATPPALGSYVGLTLTFVIIGSILYRILDEEEMLVEALPGYSSYRERVRFRLVPGLW